MSAAAVGVLNATHGGVYALDASVAVGGFLLFGVQVVEDQAAALGVGDLFWVASGVALDGDGLARGGFDLREFAAVGVVVAGVGLEGLGGFVGHIHLSTLTLLDHQIPLVDISREIPSGTVIPLHCDFGGCIHSSNKDTAPRGGEFTHSD